MADSPPPVDCGHGDEACATFVCAHLRAEPAQPWYCDYPSEDDPWPDACCAECDASLAEREERGVEGPPLDIGVVCHLCYEEARGRSAFVEEGEPLERWVALLEASRAHLRTLQDALRRDFSLSRHERWDYDQETGQLVFSNGGRPAVVAGFELAGSFSTVSRTWLWAWSNFSLLAPLRQAVLAVREHGETHRFAPLTVPKWPAEESDGWDMAAVAAKLCGARGVYRAPSANGPAFLLITSIRHAD